MADQLFCVEASRLNHLEQRGRCARIDQARGDCDIGGPKPFEMELGRFAVNMSELWRLVRLARELGA